MKAIQINYYSLDSLQIKDNIPTPQPAKNQVVVEVFAGSINPIDVFIVMGFAKNWAPFKLPITIGGDFSGVITEVGEGVKEFKIDDEVYGQATISNGSSGAFAEFTSVNSANIAYKPEKIDMNTAAALPLVGSSAIQALEEHIKLKRNDKILIHGGAGGIGHIAIQVAKHLGAYVATTVSTDDVEFVKKLGANEVIDYKKQQFELMIKEFDSVYDTVGGEVTNKSFRVLKRNGILVSMKGQPDEKLAEKYGITAIGQGTKTTTDHLNRVAQLVDKGFIKVHIDKIYPFDRVKDAFVHQQKHPKGKIVLTWNN